MENKEQANTRHSNIETGKLDPVEFINATYADYSLFDLNDTLVFFSKSISNSKQKHRSLIPKNFSKFIHCKSLPTDIKANFINRNVQDQKFLNDYTKTLQSKFETLLQTLNININVGENTAVALYKTKYAVLFNLKEVLRENILNFENFTENLKKGREAFEEVRKSKFFQKKMEDIAPEISDFLENLYECIIDPKISFEESCHLFDYYFEVSEEKSDSKIVNTVLVHFKETTYNKKERSEEYYTYLIKSLVKLLHYVFEDQAIDGIHHFFKCFRDILEATDPQYTRIVVRRISDFQKSLKAPPYCLKEFRDCFSDLKIDLFSTFINGNTIKESPKIFDVFLSILKANEIKEAQDILLKKTQTHLLKSKLSGVRYLNYEAREIEVIKPCLGSKDSKNIKLLERSLRERRDRAVSEVSGTFGSLIDGYSDAGILMEALRIIEDCPEYCSRIFVECKDLILKRIVVAHYMHVYIGADTPILSEEEKEIVDSLRFQFSSMLKIDKKASISNSY